MLSHKACVVAKPKMLWKHWSLVLLNGSDTSTDYFTFDPRLCTHSSESFCTVFGEICIVNTDFLQARDCPFVFHLKTVCVCFQVIVTIKRVVCFHRASYRHATYVMFALAARPSSCSSLGTAYQSEVNSWEERTSFPPLAASAFPRPLHALNPTRAPLRKMNLVTSVSRLLRTHCRIGIFVNCLQW